MVDGYISEDPGRVQTLDGFDVPQQGTNNAKNEIISWEQNN